jgi:hypothetical protein
VTGGLALWPLAEPAIDITHADKTKNSRMEEPALSRLYVAADPREACYIAAVGYGTYRGNTLLRWRRLLWMQLHSTKLFPLTIAAGRFAMGWWSRWRSR